MQSQEEVNAVRVCLKPRWDQFPRPAENFQLEEERQGDSSSKKKQVLQ